MNVLGASALVAALTATMFTAGTGSISSSAALLDADNAACAFRETAVYVLGELRNDTSVRGTRLRQLLIDAGAGRAGFVPTQCRSTGQDDRSPEEAPENGSGSGATDDGAGSQPGSDSAASNGHCPETAGATLDWGTPNRESGFNGPSPDDGWSLYDGPGHAGNGRRTPSAVSVADGLLTITGNENGDAEGMAWNPGQKYGRWELCVRSPKTEASSMHSLSLLWPDDEGNSPDEVDFMEIGDPTRQKVETFLHHQGGQDRGELDIDATQWHAFAVEWTPSGITNYVDGKQWWHTNEQSHLPRGPMHMTIQLDYFGGGAAEAKEHVDWARQYPPGGGSGNESSHLGSANGSPASGTGTAP